MSIKSIIFDLDGVLVEMKERHFEALNRALESIDKKYVIGLDEHLSTYDGLPTTKKLQILTKNKGLPEEVYNEVWERKQKATIDIINEEITYDERLRSIFKKLSKKYTIAVCSNSIRETTKLMLLRLGLLEFVHFQYSNQDVKNPKPNAEIFLKAMISAGVNPNETLIIEDSHIGRKAVLASGAYLLGVSQVSDVTLEAIENKINEIESKNDVKPKWQGGHMNILIPMAGKGSRFEKANYIFPKPLIDVFGKPMIQVVIENLNIEANYIFVVQKEHYEKYALKVLLNLVAPNCTIIQVDGITEGAACTTLLAKEFIDNDKPLLMANSDQYVEWDSNNFLYSMTSPEIDGGILTFKSTHPRWSFAKLGEDGFVEKVAEKEPISDLATVGIYYWSKGSDYVKYAEQMIANEDRVNGEFYTCPVYQYAINDGKKIKTFNVDKMWGMGIPSDLEYFLENYKGKI